eukprot:166002_1
MSTMRLLSCGNPLSSVSLNLVSFHKSSALILLFCVLCSCFINSNKIQTKSKRTLTDKIFKYDKWILSDSLLPRASHKMAVGYDNKMDTIWLLGGYPQHVISFQNGVFQSHGDQYPPYSFWGHGQFYTQIGNTLWIIQSFTGVINSFNLQSLKFENNYTIPVDVSWGCLTSFTNKDNHTYLFFIGGVSGYIFELTWMNLVQIFNVTSSTWLDPSIIPKLKRPRASLTCNVNNNRLYAIGGLTDDVFNSVLSSIETLYIGDMTNIANNVWQYIQNLSIPLSYSRSITYGSDIVVINGGNRINASVDVVHVINSVKNTVSIEGYLNYGINSAAVILVDSIVYVFGGTNEASIAINKSAIVNTFQYMDFSCIDNSTDHSINFQLDTYDVISCDETACAFSIIETRNIGNENIAILCNESYSCLKSSIIKTTNVSLSNIIIYCREQYSCSDLFIDIMNITTFRLYCVASLSCLGAQVNIDLNKNSKQSIVSCESSNSCKDLTIKTNLPKTQLQMYEFSENVIFDNNIGYLFEHQNIICNNNKFIQIAWSANLTKAYLKELISSKYANIHGYLPCQDIQVIYGDHSCNMIYIWRELQSLNTSSTDKECYWVNIQDIQSIHCASIPSKSPTSTPTTPPTIFTDAPSFSPSFSPTHQPTRFPTDIDKYKARMNIVYVIQKLNFEVTSGNIDIMINILKILEDNYYTDIVQYRYFTINVIDINGYDDWTSYFVVKINTNMTINSEILADSDFIGVIKERSKQIQFENDVTNDLKTHVFPNNSELQFKVQNKEDLKYYIEEEHAVDFIESYLVVIISVLIVLIGLLCSGIIKILNGREHAMIDNANWLAPLLFSLQIYDFISDIFLSYDILKNPMAYEGNVINNVIFWCGILSIVFTAIPYCTNLYFGVMIKKQNIIKNNKNAKDYFTHNMAVFIPLVVISAGCYPSLLIVSSKMFNLHICSCILTQYELLNLSKVKMKSTVTIGNGPQLFIQIIYASLTKQMSSATFLALIGSSLSIITTVSAYVANKINRKNSEIILYQLQFVDNNIDVLSEILINKISKRKGRKDELQKSIAMTLRASHQNIEIGYDEIMPKGIEICIAHYIQESELLLQSTSNGLRVQKTQTKYIQDLYYDNKENIDKIFRNHFFGAEDNDGFNVYLIINDHTNNHTIEMGPYSAITAEDDA